MKNKLYIAKYVQSFFDDQIINRRNFSINSIRSYRDAVKLFIEFAAKNLGKSPVKLCVVDITESILIDFLKHLEKNRGNSIQTRNHRLIVLKCLFRYISLREPMLLGHCSKIATIPLKRGAELPEIRYLTKDEIQAIIGAVDRSNTLGRRDHMLLLFMYNTGARVTEVTNAKISKLSFHTSYLVELLGKGNKWRTCPIWDDIADMLQEYIKEQFGDVKNNDYLFLNRSGQPISRSGISYIVRKYTIKAAAKMPSLRAKKVTPHTLRHTTAMHLLQSGVEINVIKSWLGHKSITTTNHYVEIDLEMKTQALKKCELEHPPNSIGRWHKKPGLLDWLESL